MRLVLGLDVYLATVILLSVTGIYSITGEVTLNTTGICVAAKALLLSGDLKTLRWVQLLHFP